MSKKIVLLVTACLVTIVALGAAAYAGPIRTSILTPYGSPPAATMSGTGAITFTISRYGVPTALSCTGTTFGAAVSTPSLTGYATISTFNGGSCGAWTVTRTCNIRVDADTTQNVDPTITDANVTGRAYFTNGSSGCLQFADSLTGCTFTAGGSVPASFDEVPDGSTYQGLALSGSGLQVSNVSGCLGAYSNGGAVTVSAAAFRVHVTGVSDYHLDFVD